MLKSAVAQDQGLPSRLVRSSSHLGWSAVRAEEYEDPAVAEPFTTCSDRLTLVRVTTGRYRTAGQFAAAFRRQFGCTPMAYRKGNRP